MHFDHLQIEEYDNRLYEVDMSVEPLSSLEAVGESALDQYRTLGFVSVANAFSPHQISNVTSAFLEMLDKDLPEPIQLQYESAAIGRITGMPPEERADYVRKFMYFTGYDERIAAMAYDPQLLDVVRRALGTEPEMFQDMALFKPPGIGREKPWHQDHAYFNLPLGTPVVGVWIALDQATLDNGCMVFLPGGHHEGPLPHFNRRDWQICDSEILRRGGGVAAPLPSGGCLIFDGLTPHGTPTNRSGARRKALQFHYIPKGTARTSTEERMEIFGEGAHGATC